MVIMVIRSSAMECENYDSHLPRRNLSPYWKFHEDTKPGCREMKKIEIRLDSADTFYVSQRAWKVKHQ